MGLASEGLKGLARARALLDMGKAARMERAREMGFAARDYFHGSPDLRGVREGFSPRTIRARNRRTGEFEDLPQATYVTPDQSVARSYADPERAWDYQNAEEGVLPLRVRDEGLLEIDAQGKRFNQLPLERVREQIPESQRAAFDDLVDQYADPMLLANEGSMRTGDLEVIANKLGYPGFRIRNVRDTYSGGGRPSEIVAVYEPSRFRSPEAAFDPAKRDSSNLLAGIGGAAVGAGLLAPQEADAAPFGTLARQLGKRTREAWHGSPHVYDQVDLSRMGTGEGQQVFGAGFYAADARDLADTYRRTLSPRPYAMIDGAPAHQAGLSRIDMAALDRATEIADAEGISVPDALARDAAEMKKDASTMSGGMAQSRMQRAEEIDRLARSLEGRAELVSSNSALYRLEIPDEDLLDWDAPLSEQPWFRPVDEVVAEYQAAGKKPDAYARLISKANAAKDQTGRQFYEDQLAQFGGDQSRVSAFMNEAGIPGIRYLDGVSRNAGEGTRNYVIFDDRNVNVVERNGEPIAAMPRGREEPMSAAAGFARPGAMAVAGAAAASAGLMAPQEADAAIASNIAKGAARIVARGDDAVSEFTDTFGRTLEADDFVYHVTSVPEAERIVAEGFELDPPRRNFDHGVYRQHGKGRAFFTEKDGTPFWAGRVEDQLFDQLDDPPELAIVAVPKSQVRDLKPDEIGTQDANARAYYVDGFARPGMMAAAGAGGAIAYDPVEARQTARRKREIDELTDTLIRDWQRSVAAPRPDTPRFETLAQLSEWARAQRTQGIPLYEQPLQTTADTLDRLAYGEYRRGREGLGTLAADAVMTAAEVFDPGTWAALGRQKQQDLINRITSARERANR